MKFIKYIIFLILPAFLSCQKKSDKIYSIESQLESMLDSIYAKHPNGVGFILHVEAPDKNLSWSGAVGYSNRETKTLLSSDQPGQIASITKTFTAATVFRLIEQGKLELNQPISTLLPDRTAKLLNEKEYDLDKITIGHLLSHRSGMPWIVTEKWKTLESSNLKYRWTREEQIRDAILTNTRGTIGEYRYSDVNYSLLTEIIEEITEKSFYLSIRELLNYEELDLNNTWFYSLEKDPANSKERFHQYKESRNWVSTYDESTTWGLYGAAGLVATAKDLAKFSYALGTGKVFDNPETLELMYSKIPGLNYAETDIEIDSLTGEEIEESYRMGIQILRYPHTYLIGHDGYWGSLMYYLPNQQASFAFYGLNADEILDFDKLYLDITNIIDK